MKSKFLAAAAIAMSIMTTGCAGNKQISKIRRAFDEAQAEKSAFESSAAENDVDENTESVALTHECTIDNVSFRIDEDWEKYDDKEGAFVSQNGKAVAIYMLQGVSHLGSFTPEEFYKILLDTYGEEREIISSDAAMSDFVTADAIPAKIARIEMTDGNSLYFVDVLIVPQKNTVVTFAANAVKKSYMPIDLREITNTAKINIATEDCISGNTFTVGDGSELCLKDNGEFIYYQSETDHDKAYRTGKYEVYRGQAAIDKVDSMRDYGLTKEEQEQFLSNYMNGYRLGGSTPADFIDPENYYNSDNLYHICQDSYYAVILHNEKLVESGNTSDMDNSALLYIGFYIPEIELADMINAAAAYYSEWTLKGKTD